MTQTVVRGRRDCFELWISVIRACFGFRISNFGFRVWLPLTTLLLVACGCETPPQTTKPAAQQTAGQGTQTVEQTSATIPSGFGPAKINILPLSEITGAAGIGQDAKLDVYVALLDAFGCPIKAPCTLRFEVYEYVKRSAQTKGQRLMIWPDIDLTRPVENNNSWQDFLRAYEFDLDLRIERDKTYILETTYLGSDGKRLSGDWAIHAGQ
jgi:hypothetical protein